MPLKPRNKALQSVAVLLLAFFAAMASAYATDSYSLANGANQNITEHSVCKAVTNASGKSIMIPTKASGEWSSFYTNPPAGVTASTCVTNGYFVHVNTTSTGNYGGISGANAWCYTRLNADAWLGKATSAVADASKVKAFLCDTSSCQNLLPSTTYYFANTANATVGGASFTTDASSVGPNNSADWSGATYFSGSYTYWTGRGVVGGATTAWVTTPVSSTSCTDWTVGVGPGTGRVGVSNSGGGGSRWQQTTNTCSTARTVICYVDPSGGAPTSATYHALATAVDTTTITIPATAQAGDLAILVDATISSAASGAPPTTVVPAGFTQVTNTSGQGAGGAYNRMIVSAKILGSGDAGANLTTMSGSSNTGYQRKAIAIFRPNIPANSFTAGSVSQETSTGVPTNQTVTASSGAAPLIVFSAYRAGASIATRGFTPAEDAELAAGGVAFFAKYKIYNSSPANITTSMPDTGNENMLHSMYFELH